MWPVIWTIPITGWTIKGYGLMLMFGFLSGIWLAARRAGKVKANPDVILNIGFIALIFGVIGSRAWYVIHYWRDQFAGKGIWAAINVTAGGLTFFGGLFGAMAAIVIYLWIKRLSIRMYLDILAPSVMWGHAFGRLGCLLNGCCWGAVCASADGTAALPWAVRFPYASPPHIYQWTKKQAALPAELIHVGPNGTAWPIRRESIAMQPEQLQQPYLDLRNARQAHKDAVKAQADSKTRQKLRRKVDRAEKRFQRFKNGIGDLLAKADVFPDETTGPGARARPFLSRIHPGQPMSPSELRDLAMRYRSLPTHPTQLYAAVNSMLISLVLTALFYRRKRHGVLISATLIMYPLARFVMEFVREDNPRDVFGLTISQAVGLAAIVFAVLFYLWLRRQPLRSPRAVPFIPPVDDAAKKPKKASP